MKAMPIELLRLDTEPLVDPAKRGSVSERILSDFPNPLLDGSPLCRIFERLGQTVFKEQGRT